MKKKDAWIGLDVHKNSITMAVFIGNSNQLKMIDKIPHDIAKLKKIIKKLEKQYIINSCYEAGGCGFIIYRELRKAKIPCIVVAPSLIPKNNNRIKTDKRDAKNLAKLLRAGLLTPVTIIDEDLERARDLVRFREQQVKTQTKTKQQLMAFLLRKGVPVDSNQKWGQTFLDSLRSLELESEDKVTLERYISHYNYISRLVIELENDIEELSVSSMLGEKVKILKAFRGIETLTAMTIITHIPDFRTFHSPKQLSSFAGLTPSECSSGDKQSRGRITKTGQKLLRKALINAAQQYSMPGKPGHVLKKRRKNAPAFSVTIAERAERRLQKRFFKLCAVGKHYNSAKTAVARELVSFLWEAMISYYGGEFKEAG